MANLKQYGGSLKDSSNLSGIYRARVENNVDDLQIGRVQVRVPMIHGTSNTNGISNNSLPWASPCFFSAGYDYGSFIVPEVGEYVFVMFEDKDASKPVYLGSSFGSGATNPKSYGSDNGRGVWQSKEKENEVPIGARLSDPSKKIIYKSPKGASIEIEEQNENESISIIDGLGQVLKFESNMTDGATHKRKNGDIDINGAITGNTKGTRIILMDSKKQKLEMIANDKDTHIHIGNGITGIEISPDDNGISIKASNGSKISISNSGIIDIEGSKNIDIKADMITLNGEVTIIDGN